MFGFGKKKTDEEPAFEESPVRDSPATSEEGYEGFDRSSGPWDEEEKNTEKGYIDFGAVRVKITDGLNMRLDVEQSTQQLVAVTLTHGNGVLQLQAFAAPKSVGLWDDIRREIARSVRRQGGTVEIVESPLGRQLISRLPATTADGRPGFRIARFVGVDGPRWFLRGVFSGDAAVNAESAAKMEEIFRSVVVVRGEEPMAPRDLIALKMPQQVLDAQKKQEDAWASTNRRFQEPPQRGPEIAEIR